MLLNWWSASDQHASLFRLSIIWGSFHFSLCSGIPDFRGPKGVWTLEGKGQKVESSTQFGDTQPTLTHYALVVLVQTGYVKHVISQNVDGLHLKSGLARWDWDYFYFTNASLSLFTSTDLVYQSYMAMCSWNVVTNVRSELFVLLLTVNSSNTISVNDV